MPYTAYAMVVGTGDADHGPGHYFAIASVNAGLATSAFKGLRRKNHLGRIEQLLHDAMSKSDVLGIAFCEAGDSFKGLHGTEKQLFENAVRSGSSKAGCKMDPTILFAPRSTFVIALRGDIQICGHGMFDAFTSQDPRRSAQWIEFICPNKAKMRLVNSHQPSSNNNPYTFATRSDVCTGIFRRATSIALLFPPDGAAEHELQTTTPVRVVMTGDLNVDKNQIANYGKECGLDGKLETCAANRRKAYNCEKTMNVPNSKHDDQKLQKHCDLAILIHCEGVQMDSVFSALTLRTMWSSQPGHA